VPSQSDKAPEVDMKKWGDRVLGGTSAPTLPVDVSSLALEAQPIGIIVDAEQIARAYMAKGGPKEFNQMLLAFFKDAGAPVEGGLTLRLAHGKIFKLKSKPGEFFFRYMWMPLELCAAYGLAGEEQRSLVN
jgi:hypothetical protein